MALGSRSLPTSALFVFLYCCPPDKRMLSPQVISPGVIPYKGVLPTKRQCPGCQDPSQRLEASADTTVQVLCNQEAGLRPFPPSDPVIFIFPVLRRFLDFSGPIFRKEIIGLGRWGSLGELCEVFGAPRDSPPPHSLSNRVFD